MGTFPANGKSAYGLCGTRDAVAGTENCAYQDNFQVRELGSGICDREDGLLVNQNSVCAGML